MSSLERFTLCIRVRHRASFIDGTYLDNAVLSRMPHLVKFCFDIVTHVTISGQVNPSSDDVRRTFIERGHHVDCYIDYFKYRSDRRHVYSVPFNMNRIFAIKHSFPGGNFINVRILCINDVEQFLSDINTRLPCLNKLHVKYEHLTTVTKNFTRIATRINCAKVKSLTFHDPVDMRHSKDFYLYFPSLQMMFS
jgi:hypothetical protein